jgi:hypothetical protein
MRWCASWFLLSNGRFRMICRRSDGYDWRRQLEDREPRSNGGQDVSWAPQGDSGDQERSPVFAVLPDKRL